MNLEETLRNEFITNLRDHLKEEYGTNHSYTYGGAGFRSEQIGDAYCLLREDERREVEGFCFRKDLCTHPPLNEEVIKKSISNFARKYEEEGVKIEDDSRMRIEDEEYFIHAYIGEGLAGEVSVYFMSME